MRNRPKQTNNSTPAEASFTIGYMTSYLCALIIDASRIFAHVYSIADATRDCQTIENRMASEGLGFATTTLPCLITGVLNAYEGHDASFPQFRLKRGTEYPVLLHRLFHLALESNESAVKGRAFDVIYSISVAFKKYRGDYSRKVLLKQFNDFVKTDEELDNIDLFEESVYSILEGAREKIAAWLSTFTLTHDGLKPRPGPGATNTPTKKTERYRPRVLYKQIDNVLSYQEWWYATPWHACLRSREFINLHNNAVAEPTARFKFVPKTSGKPRGICIEENEMQVMQQSVRVYLYRFFDRKFYPNIALREQKINSQLALQSSRTKEYATIDMSEASDRVSRELVSWLFQDNQELHDVLMALSTRWVIPPEELSDVYPYPLRTKKYAPMGSALCFPIMTLVHYALVLSIMEHGTYDTDLHDFSREVFVYGDDIVLPSYACDDVFHWLPKFGMKLNKTKSFVKSHFRESCGIHAFNGVDVTPVFIKYSPYHDSAKAIASAYAVEEQLRNKGFTLTAYFQRAKIREQYGTSTDLVPCGLSQAGISLPFDGDDLRRFKLNRRRKWNRNLQCYTYAVDRIQKPIIKSEIEKDDDAYLRWLWVNAKSEGPPGSSFGKWTIGDSYGDLTLSRRLVPESALVEQEVSRIVEKSLRQYPTGRYRIRNDAVSPKVITLRKSLELQQWGAEEFCVFC